MFENNLIPDPKWEKIPQIETSTIAKGGLGGAANAQAQAILNNIEYTKRHTILVFDTLAEAQVAAATLPDDQKVEAPFKGRTAKFAVTNGSLSFMEFIGSPLLTSDKWILSGDWQPGSQSAIDTLCLMLKSASEKHPDASLHACVGDVANAATNPTTGSMYEFGYPVIRSSVEQNSRLKWDSMFFIPGNHDRDGTGAGAFERAWSFRTYREYVGPEYFEVRKGNFTLLCIGDMAGQNSGEAFEHVLQWFEKRLQDSVGRNVMVFIHQPISGTFSSSPDDTQVDSARLIASIEKYDNIAAICSGHIGQPTQSMVKHGTTFVNLNLNPPRDVLDTWVYSTFEFSHGEQSGSIRRWNPATGDELVSVPINLRHKAEVGPITFDGRNEAPDTSPIVRDTHTVYRSLSNYRFKDTDNKWKPTPGVHWLQDLIAGDDSNDAVPNGFGVGIRFMVPGAAATTTGGSYDNYATPAYGAGGGVAAVRLTSDQTEYYSAVRVFARPIGQDKFDQTLYPVCDFKWSSAFATRGQFFPQGGNVVTGTDVSSIPGTSDTGALNYAALTSGGEVRGYRDSAVSFQMGRSGSDGAVAQIRKNGVAVGSISVTANATTFNTTSDATLKTDKGLSDSTQAVGRIQSVRIHDYEWKSTGESDRGVFAQELHETHPLAVTVGGDEIVEGESIYRPWSVDYSKLVPDLVLALQSALKRIEQLESK